MPGDTVPLPDPPSRTVLVDQAYTGIIRPPIQQIRLFSPAEWEEFILEWAVTVKQKYVNAEHAGAAGDQGRDIIAVVSQNPYVWDNYQCKHYEHVLHPSDIWIELAKLCYYTYINSYSKPRNYYFVSPHGAGTSLSRLLKKPEELRSMLIEQWPTKCGTELIKGKQIKLQGALLDYVREYDFSAVSSLPIAEVIEQHRTTSYFVFRFGGGLPGRPEPEAPPEEITESERRYVQQLLEAYSDHLKTTFPTVDGLIDEGLRKHFRRSRQQFYCAESLNAFSRDTLPPGSFAHLKSELESGVIDVCEANHEDGYVRVQATTQAARVLQITHALAPRLKPDDRAGLCHHLANEDRLTWVKK